MIRGILYVAGACALWGLIFVVPLYLEGCEVIDIALGRYFFFALFSLGCLLKKKGFRYPADMWRDALKLSFSSTLLHYCALIMCMRYLGSTFITLILGLSSLCIAIYAGYKEKASPIQVLVPCLLTACGLPLLYLAKMETVSLNLLDCLLGSFFALLALGSWVVYLIANNFYLKKYESVPVQDWISLIGLASLPFVLVGFGARLFFIRPNFLHADLAYLVATFVLGVGSSWLASFLWNKGLAYIPLSISGPLVILETIFGLLFVYIYQKKIPVAIEWSGMLLILSGIFLCLRSKAQHVTMIPKKSV